MPILRMMPLTYTLRRPTLNLNQHLQRLQQLSPTDLAEHAERGHAVVEEDLGNYPTELFQLRVRTIQEHISEHYPLTYVYIASLVMVLVVMVVLVATVLALHVSDGKPWVLGVIVIVILVFISKMSFLSRMEKAHKDITALLQSFNDQDMLNYGVLYRLRPLHHSPAHTSFIYRCAHKLNLGLPHWSVDLTTIDHIDEYSFQDHPAEGPHASPEEIQAMENELPRYRPKAEADDLNQQELVLGEALPPKYQEVVVEIATPSAPVVVVVAAPTAAHLEETVASSSLSRSSASSSSSSQPPSPR
ncbi:hypothetical protein EDD21DRAFT_352864 [Dissophora ornata]|nr:hypothetical protein EDD21DRAFT_352864 [Dissophora ornata]